MPTRERQSVGRPNRKDLLLELPPIPDSATIRDIYRPLQDRLRDLQAYLNALSHGAGGDLDMNKFRVINLGWPQAASDAASKEWVERNFRRGARAAAPAVSVGGTTIIQRTALCVIQEIPAGLVDGVNRTFFTTKQPSPPLIWVVSGGRDMYPFGDYVLTAEEGKFVYTEGAQPKEGEEHWVWYFCGDAVPIAPNVGDARFLDGGFQSINWGYNAAYDIKGDVSFGFWAKFHANSLVNGILFAFTFHQGTSATNSPWATALAGSSGSWDIRYFHDVGALPDPDEIITFDTNIANDTWRYIGISRDVSEKTVYLYIGDGERIIQEYSATYTNDTDGGTSTARRLVAGSPSVINEGGLNQLPARFTIQEHYLWNTLVSSVGHEAAMHGNAPSSGLVFACPTLGTSPEVDTAGGATGALTGTTLVEGHP